MAEQQGTTPQAPPPPPVDGGSQAQPQSAPGTPPVGQAGDPPRSETLADPAQLVMKEAADKLREAAASLTDTDRAFAQYVDQLARQASDQVRLNEQSFQHELAWAVQDIEKARGGQLVLSQQARSEVTRLAGSAPGLENERMQELMRSTPVIADRSLVSEIRRTGAFIGQQADQNAPAIRERVEVIANKFRLMQRVDPAGELGQTTSTSPPPGDAAARRQASAARPEQSNRGGPPQRPDQAIRPSQQPPVIVQTGFTGAVMDGVLRAMRPSGPGNTQQWEAGAQPFGQRLAAFRERDRDDQTLRRVENSGRAALDAMEGFRNGEGAAVLNRIREAARSDPGGMTGVLSEMREGGKFAELRQQFNSALSDERGAATAYDMAASALARYGEDRKAVEQVLQRAVDSVKSMVRSASAGASPGVSPS
jgi:hypothetical protein